MTPLNLTHFAESLPLFAEEGGYRESLRQGELLAALQCQGDGGEALGALAFARRLFEAIGLLDMPELERGHWAFVSFPAYLMARSLIETLATPGQGLFHPGYWQQDGSKPTALVEEQRRLLAELEDRRTRFHPMSDAIPIRFVYVAWGLIRLGNDFLLVHREDKNRPDTNNFVFPGGRFTIDDLPPEKRGPDALRRLQGGNLEWITDALSRTLSRELDEELGLRVQTDYIPTVICDLKPHRKIEGARNNHAYTEYRIRLFSLSLSPVGEARLLDRTAASDGFAWLKLDELLAPRGRADGKTPFIDALKSEFAEDLGMFLAELPDSSGTPEQLTGDSNAVDIPVIPTAPFLLGKTGKEKSKPVPLSAAELALLGVLVAHARGFPVRPEKAHLCLLGGGWIKLLSEESRSAAQSLIRTLADARLPWVQMAAGTFCRLSIDPAIVFFGEAHYRYRLDGYRLHIAFALDAAPWATQIEIEKEMDLDPTMTLIIRTILTQGALWKGEKIVEGKDTDREFREKIDRHLRPLGLRKLIRTLRDDYVIQVPAAPG